MHRAGPAEFQVPPGIRIHNLLGALSWCLSTILAKNCFQYIKQWFPTAIANYSPEEICLLHLYTFSLNLSWDISCGGWPNPVSSHRPGAPAPVSHFCSPQLPLHQWRTSCGAHEPAEKGWGSGTAQMDAVTAQRQRSWGADRVTHTGHKRFGVPWCFCCIHLVSERTKEIRMGRQKMMGYWGYVWCL